MTTPAPVARGAELLARLHHYFEQGGNVARRIPLTVQQINDLRERDLLVAVVGDGRPLAGGHYFYRGVRVVLQGER